MIEANNLRIGNSVYVTQTNGNPNGWSLIKISLYNLDSAFYHPEWFKGIPITKTRLKKLGFERCGVNLLRHVDGNLNMIYFDIDSNGLIPSGSTKYARLKYVHEIQNLYFALMKIELKVKGKL